MDIFVQFTQEIDKKVKVYGYNLHNLQWTSKQAS
jgi:hypothetical protein